MAAGTAASDKVSSHTFLLKYLLEAICTPYVPIPMLIVLSNIRGSGIYQVYSRFEWPDTVLLFSFPDGL